MHKNPNDPYGVDQSRLLVAVVLSVLVFFLFYHFVEKPHIDRLKQQQALQEQVRADTADLAGDMDASGAVIAQDAPTAVVLDREAAIAQNPRVQIDTPRLSGSIILKGGRVDDLSLKEHYVTVERDENVHLFMPRSTEHPHYAEAGWVSGKSGMAVPGPETPWRVSTDSNAVLTPQTPVLLVWDNGQGLTFERKISVDENYLFQIEQRVVNRTDKDIEIFPYYLVSRHGIPAGLQDYAIKHEGPLGYVKGELEEIDYSDLIKDPQYAFETTGGWLGFSDQYWFTGFVPDQKVPTKARFVYTPDSHGPEGRFQVDLTMAGVDIPAGGVGKSQAWLFAGAKELELLQSYEEDLGFERFELVLDLGIWYVITKPFMLFLHFLAGMTGNIAIAILLLTVVVKLAAFPLTNKAYRSMAGMKKLSPKMKELQKVYGDDRQKLQQAILELYQKEQVNPLSGCWPMLLQIPIFFALYKVILISVELRHAPFWGWVEDMSTRDPTTMFNLFGLIPWQPPEIFMVGAWPCLLAISMIWQRRFNPEPADKTQAQIMKFMPYFMAYLLSRFSAGLVIYWTWNNTLSVLQQYWIMRSMGVEVSLFGRDHVAEREKEEQEAAEKEAAEKEAKEGAAKKKKQSKKT